MVNFLGNFVSTSGGAEAATLAGIDGCRAGWLIALWRPKARRLTFRIEADWTAARQVLVREGVALAGVDMPIGLTDQGPRRCDLAARALLPKDRKSSVFPPPRRYMLACAAWQEAQALGREREGKGLSKQAWNITGKIREIDEGLTPEDQKRVIEVHPELAFHRLGGAVPRKVSAEGESRRRALLAEAGLPSLDPWLDRFPRSKAKPDDLIDAAACALVAEHARRGRATRLPAEEPPRDGRGLRMEIWF